MFCKKQFGVKDDLPGILTGMVGFSNFVQVISILSRYS